jgi:GPH family glycoside/pentoside/hexuronide:cation symporter
MARSVMAQQMTRYQQLGWAAGSFGIAVMLGVLTSYGLFYMTTYLGVGALLAGQLIGFSKIYDLLTDPVMGQISDRTQSVYGRRRPYLLFGGGVSAAAIVLFFFVPDLGSEVATAIYLSVVLIVFATGYTLFSVPYFAMPAEMTTNADERTLLMSQRIFFSTLGVLMISYGGQWLIRYFGGGADGYIRTSWVMAALVVVTMGVTFFTTRGTRTLAPSPRDRYGWRRQWRLVAENRPFRIYLAAKICLFMAQSSVQGSLLFFAYYVLDSDEFILAAFGIGYTLGSVLSLYIWNILITRLLGKRNAFVVSAIGLGLVFLSWLLAGTGEHVAGLYGRFGLLGIFSAGAMVSGSAMLPDIMEYDRQRTGVNQEGLYAAAFSMIEKVANAVGPMFVGFMLGATGFVAARGGELPQQPQSAIDAIRLAVSVVPFLLAFLAAFIMRSYSVADIAAGPGDEPG